MKGVGIEKTMIKRTMGNRTMRKISILIVSVVLSLSLVPTTTTAQLCSTLDESACIARSDCCWSGYWASKTGTNVCRGTGEWCCHDVACGISDPSCYNCPNDALNCYQCAGNNNWVNKCESGDVSWSADCRDQDYRTYSWTTGGTCYWCKSNCQTGSCSLSDYCTGTNRCGSVSGDTRYYLGQCTVGACRFITEDCNCGAFDSDGGKDYTTGGTCTDYTGCSGGRCTSTGYGDSCPAAGTVREYYVTGSGDSATCTSTDYECNNLGGSGWTCSAGKCVEIPSDVCYAGDTLCYSYTAGGSDTCQAHDPTVAPIAGEGCCWGYVSQYQEGQSVRCCYDNYDNIKAGCDYCAWDSFAGQYYWTDVSDACQTGGWGCGSGGQTTDCISGCCNLNCNDATGCGTTKTPQDAKCSSQTCTAADGYPNRKKFCSTDGTCACKCGPCGSNNDCASGYCCVDDPTGPKPGTGKCEGPAAKIYSGSAKWLCATASPASWQKCTSENIEKIVNSGGKSYICLNENGEYGWSETSSTNQFMIILALLFFLAVLLKKILYKGVPAKKFKIRKNRR